MTAQSMETIYINGKKRYMISEPLGFYLDTIDNPPEFFPPNSGCWRGYYGRWKIKDNRLYLTGLDAYVAIDGKIEEVGKDYLFPDQRTVFAEWFSGDIRVVMGKEIQYVHMGYESIFEKELILQIENGVVKNQKEILNS